MNIVCRTFSVTYCCTGDYSLVLLVTTTIAGFKLAIRNLPTAQGLLPTNAEEQYGVKGLARFAGTQVQLTALMYTRCCCCAIDHTPTDTGKACEY